MASNGERCEPLLPVSTSPDEPARSAAHSGSTGSRAAWVRVIILATAGAMGPLLVLAFGGLVTSRVCPPVGKQQPDIGASEAQLELMTAHSLLFPDHAATAVAAAAGNASHLHAGSSEAFSSDQALQRGGDLQLPAEWEDISWLRSQADALRHSWGLGTRLQFVRLAETQQDMDNAIASPIALSDGQAAVLVFLQGPPPVRREEGEPFMAVATDSRQSGSVLASVIPVAAINSAAALLEARLARRLFPIRLEVASFNKSAASAPPFAMHDVSSGRIVLDEALVQHLQGAPAGLADGLSVFADSLFRQISRVTRLQGSRDVMSIANVVLRAAVSALGVAIAYQVPLWFCIACPAVLGLLAPVVINLGMGALADAACEHWHLPQDECNDLWYGAFAAGMVLSLASAVPIVFICKLPQCAHRKAP